METFFWIALSVLVYTYLGYGAMAWIAIQLKRAVGISRKKQLPFDPSYLPTLAFVIPACDEERLIQQKIRNTLALDYPTDRLQIIVVTDGSRDKTPTLAAAFAGILHLHDPVRKGKAAAMMRALDCIQAADLVCFSDANSLVSKNALRLMTQHFRDPETGAVAGEKRVLGKEGSALSGEGMYWTYESSMKELDAGLFTAVGAAGELFCIRKALIARIPDDTILDDLHLSLSVALHGYRIAYEPRAIAEEMPSVGIRDEYERKVRIAAGAFQTISRFRKIMIPWPHPILSFQFISRRIFRWVLCPLALPILFFSDLFLVWQTPTPFFLATLFCQIIFHSMALAGFMAARKVWKLPRLFFIPFYFDFMHGCFFPGFFRYILGRQMAVWQRVDRYVQQP